ncbi:MFS transporter [Marinilongibacter aquaticus]|uniref:MFS transporter n=1 Tax=Marinilongibacter aquaticus TaxID=2975157 RepID=UPI0021BD5915|nr:MFS transporter [Marinilongibacter aquaticus]UBM57224.1 MFS transporter [Marinilongibacter aquaticus]
MSSKEKRLLFILASVNFTHIVDFMILMPLGPQLMSIFGIDAQEFGFVVACYGLSAAFSGFGLAFFADRFDRKKVLLFAYIGFVMGTFACAFSPSYRILLIARTITGIFGGMINSQVMSIVADTFGYERRASAMGIIMTAFAVASVVGVPGGLYLTNEFGWHAPFFAIGGLGLIITALVVFFVPNVRDHLENGSPQSANFEVIRNILKDRNQLRALGLSMFIMLGSFSVIPYVSPTLVSNIGYSQEDIYLIYLTGGILTIFTAPLLGKLADKKGKYFVFALFALMSFVPIYFITNMFPAPLYVILAISGLFFITNNGRMIPTQAMVTGVVTPKQRGGFMAVNSSVQLMSQAIATSIGGAILVQRDNGYLDHYAWVGFFSMAMIISSILIAKKVKNVE